jgi:predicted SAM-dependent methyltransferase
MTTKTASYLKRSQFIVGLVRAFRGLIRDIRVLVWLVKRNGQIADYLEARQLKKLQLGTSNNVLDGWLNSDVFPNHGSVIYLDATMRFPFDDNTFNYIVGEHMIEHIEFQAGQFMLRECFRVLKPGGRVRFATPDLQVVLSLYSREKIEAQISYIEWSTARFLPEVQKCKEVFVINNLFRSWGHCFLYDAATLHHALNTSGFRDIKFYKPGNSEDPILENLETHGRQIESEGINQFETIVVEGCKER